MFPLQVTLSWFEFHECDQIITYAHLYFYEHSKNCPSIETKVPKETLRKKNYNFVCDIA
jgi:uncharacterized membrane protein